MSAKPDYVVNTLTRPNASATTGGYVINLTSSTTPMALSQPKDPTLAQYTFFVSRRREDGRERFRLHMGYFETIQAAEEMLAVVREVYPSAWAGEAPGKKLRPNTPSAAAPAAAAPIAPAPAPKPAAPVAAPKAAAPVAPKPAAPAAAAQPRVAQKPAAPAIPAPAPAVTPHPFSSLPRQAAPSPQNDEPFVLSDGDTDFRPINPPVVNPPVVQPPAAKVVSPPPVAKPAAARPAAPKAAPAKPAAKPAQAKAPAKPAAPPKAAAPAKPAAAAPAKPTAPAAARPAPARPPAVAPKIAAQVSAPALHASKPAAPVPAAPPVQAAAPAPVARPAAPEPIAARAAPEPTVQMPAMTASAAVNNVRQVIEELDDLSDTQTIRLLERHSPYREGSREADVDEAIRVIKPEDAQAMQSIKSDVKRNAPVLFAVQLDWSVTPFDMAKVPPLAIFNAYTLYTTEANRDGRAWFGLRLGFFSDAVSAKQVAYYVRSDFKTVSVVPVTTIEKERATDLNASRSGIYKAANIKDVAAPTPQSIAASNASGVFQLLEDDTPAHIEQDVDGEMSPRFSKPAAGQPAAPAASAAPAAPAAPAVDAKKGASKARKPGPRGVKRDAHAHVDEETLDQTLEILGAHTLEITNDSAENTGVRHLRVKIDKKGSKFASLIDRLSGKK
jgi:hypothetical protein